MFTSFPTWPFSRLTLFRFSKILCCLNPKYSRVQETKTGVSIRFAHEQCKQANTDTPGQFPDTRHLQFHLHCLSLTHDQKYFSLMMMTFKTPTHYTFDEKDQDDDDDDDMEHLF